MKAKYSELFKNKNFMRLFIADMINRFGDSIDSIALTWVVYFITGSASWSALIFGLNRIPSILIQPLAGAYVEKKDKKTIMVITDLLRALLVAYIATKLVMGILNQWDILVVTLLISTVEAFRQPTSLAVIPQILSNEELENGMALENSASRIVELVGLSLAGIIIAAFGNAFAIYLDMMTFLLSALILTTLHIKKVEVDINAKKEGFFASFKDGVKMMFNNEKLKAIVLLAIFLNAVLTPLNSLQAPLVSEVLHANEIMLSIISVTIVGGMIVGPALYSKIKERLKPKTLIIVSAYSLSLPFIGVCLIGNYIGSPFLAEILVGIIFFCFGFLISMLNMYTSIELIKSCEAQYLARVGSLLIALSICVTPIVSMLLSVITQFISTYMIFMSFGVFNIIIVLFVVSRKEYD